MRRMSKWRTKRTVLVIISVLFLTWIWVVNQNASYLYRKSSFGRLHSPASPHSWEVAHVETKRHEELKLRQLEIKQAMRFVWYSYMNMSSSVADEIKPISGEPYEKPYGGIGCTLIDSLDTLLIMNMEEEFIQGRNWVYNHFDFDSIDVPVSIFETVIRILGGLLGAYELSGDVLFKEKAREVGEAIKAAFDESKGVFFMSYVPKTRAIPLDSYHTIRPRLSEAGGIQLELRYLSRVTQDESFSQLGDKFYTILKQSDSYDSSGLYANHLDAHGLNFAEENTHISFGALGDSFYEYLLKVYILGGSQETWLRDVYNKAIDGMEKFMLDRSFEDEGILSLKQYNLMNQRSRARFASIHKLNKQSETSENVLLDRKHGFDLPVINHMEHLACFLPGLIALGTLQQESQTYTDEKLDIAKKLAETCYLMYAKQLTGLAPESINFPSFTPNEAQHRLRPEAIESFFYLYRITKDKKYQEYGWTVFQALKKYSKSKFGFAELKDVNGEGTENKEDRMESYFLAETLKYHFLLQGPEEYLRFDEYVLSTEGHPFSIYAH